MFKLHDVIPATPQTISEGIGKEHAGKAEVVYIHPEGRFYCLRFDYMAGSFTESRFFSEAEKELGRKMGLFNAPRQTRIALPRGSMPSIFFPELEDLDPFEEMGVPRPSSGRQPPEEDEFDAAMF